MILRECRINNCFNFSAPKRTICYKCRSKQIRESNRAIFAYYMIRKSAKKRGIDFSLTKEHFLKIINEAGYIKNSGRLKDQLTIDRKNGKFGYIDGNIQVISKSENSSKFHNKIIENPF